MVGGGRKLMPGEGYDRSDWKKQEENHTKTFAQSDALSRGRIIKVMLTGAARALCAITSISSFPPVQTSCPWTYTGYPSLRLNCRGDWRQGKVRWPEDLRRL